MAILGISPDEMLDTQLGPNDEQRRKLNLLAATQPKQPVGIPPAAQPTPARGIPTPLGAPPNIPSRMPNVTDNPLAGITPETTLGRPTPAYDRLQALEAQGRPQLHGVKKFFDVLSQAAPLGRRIEAAIPGSPGYYDAQLGQAQTAANEEMAQERTQNPPEVAAIRAQGELERQRTADADKQQKPIPDEWQPVTGTNLEVNKRTGESRPIQGMQQPAPKNETEKAVSDWLGANKLPDNPQNRNRARIALKTSERAPQKETIEDRFFREHPNATSEDFLKAQSGARMEGTANEKKQELKQSSAQALKNMNALIKQDTPAANYAFLMNFIGMSYEGVRGARLNRAEIERAAMTRALPDALQHAYDLYVQRKQLTPQQKQDMLNTAKAIAGTYDEQEGPATQTYNGYIYTQQADGSWKRGAKAP